MYLFCLLLYPIAKNNAWHRIPSVKKKKMESKQHIADGLLINIWVLFMEAFVSWIDSSETKYLFISHFLFLLSVSEYIFLVGELLIFTSDFLDSKRPFLQGCRLLLCDYHCLSFGVGEYLSSHLYLVSKYGGHLWISLSLTCLLVSIHHFPRILGGQLSTNAHAHSSLFLLY